MALSRKAKTWLVVLSIPILLLVGAGIALKLYFTNERLKALVIPRIEEATGRSISIHEVGLSIFPSLAVRIDSLSVANRAGHGFSDQPLLSLERLVLNLRLMPLLSGRLEIPAVVLQRPRLLLEISKDGIRNYRAEHPAPTTQDTGASATTSAPTGMALLLSNLQVVDGEIDMFDLQENTVTRLHGLNHQMKIELPAATSQVRIEGLTTINDISYGSPVSAWITGLRLTIDHTLLYDLDKDLLSVQRGEGTLEQIPLKISGTIARLTGNPEPNLVIEAAKVSIPELLSLVPKDSMTRTKGVQGTGSAQIKIIVSGIITDTTKADYAGAISTTDASIQYAGLPKPISNISLVADFTRTRAKQQFRLTQFSARLGDNPISATMNVVNFDDPTLTMTANASLALAEVKDYYPLESGTQLAGLLKANVNIDGRISNPTGIKAGGTMEFQGVTLKTSTGGSAVHNLSGTIAFNNQVVESKKLSMQLGKSDLVLGFWLKNYLSLVGEVKGALKPVANLTVNSNHLFTSDLTGEPATGSAPASSKQPQEPRQKSTLPLPNVDMDISANIGILTMEKFELQNVRSTLNVKNGIVTIQSLSCNSFEGSVITRGTINMQKPERPTYDLVLDINGVSANALLSNFTSFGRFLHGKLTMNTTMRGELDDTLGLVPQTLTGEGRAQVENGNLTGWKVNSTIASLLKLPDLQQIDFKDWSNTFSISNGRINIKDLKIAALGADYVVNGSQGLDGSLDYSMAVLLSEQASAKVSVPGFAGEALKFLKDESGRLKLDLSVGGTSSNPAVALDTRQAQLRAEEAAKQKLGDEATKAGEQLKQKGQDLLKDIFKKKK